MIHILDEGDLCSLGLLVLLLTYVGDRAVAGQPTLRRVGFHAGAWVGEAIGSLFDCPSPRRGRAPP